MAISPKPKYNYWIEWSNPDLPTGSRVVTTGSQDFGLPIEPEAWVALMLGVIRQGQPRAFDIQLYRRQLRDYPPPELVRELELP